MLVCKVEVYVQYDEEAAEECNFDGSLDHALEQFVEGINDLGYALVVRTNVI